MNHPMGVAVYSNNLYVHDRYNYRIQKFDLSGNYISQWGTYGTGDGQLNNGGGISVDSAGNVYLADTYNDRVQKFSPAGTFLAKYGSTGSGNAQLNRVSGILFDGSDNMYICDQFNHRIQKLDPAGNFITKWGKNGGDGSYGSAAGEFSGPLTIGMDVSGAIYVTDYNNNRVQKFSPVQ